MSLSQKLEVNEKLSTETQQSTESDIPMNPFTPTRAQVFFIMIGIFFVLDRRGFIHALPFEIGLLGGIIPVECLMWTLVIADMARKDILQIWSGIKGSLDPERKEETSHRR